MKKRIQYFMLLLSVMFILYGIHGNEHLVVLRKAINICLECIGIG